MLILEKEMDVDARFVVANEGLVLAGRELVMLDKWRIKLPFSASCLAWGELIAVGLLNAIILFDDNGSKVKVVKVEGRVVSCHSRDNLIAVGFYKDGANFVELIDLNGERLWIRQTPWLPKGVYIGENEVAIASGHGMIVDMDGRIRWRRWLGSQIVKKRRGYVFDSWKGAVELERGELRLLFPEKPLSMDFSGEMSVFLTSKGLVLFKEKTIVEAELEGKDVAFWGNKIVVVGEGLSVFKVHRSLYEQTSVGAKGEEVDNSSQRGRRRQGSQKLSRRERN